MKPRHHLYLDDELTAELEHLASKPGASKSAIVTAALRQYIRGGGEDQRDEALRNRLDRLSRQIGKLASDVDLIIQSQSQHVWLHLLLTAHVPGPDEAERRTALQRYEKYTKSVADALAKQKLSANAHGLRNESEHHEASSDAYDVEGDRHYG